MSSQACKRAALTGAIAWTKLGHLSHTSAGFLIPALHDLSSMSRISFDDGASNPRAACLEILRGGSGIVTLTVSGVSAGRGGLVAEELASEVRGLRGGGAGRATRVGAAATEASVLPHDTALPVGSSSALQMRRKSTLDRLRLKSQ